MHIEVPKRSSYLNNKRQEFIYQLSGEREGRKQFLRNKRTVRRQRPLGEQMEGMRVCDVLTWVQVVSLCSGYNTHLHPFTPSTFMVAVLFGGSAKKF